MNNIAPTVTRRSILSIAMFAVITLISMGGVAQAQSNTFPFPSSGNVGIGTRTLTEEQLADWIRKRI